MVIFPLAPDQTIAQMWSSGARGGSIKVADTEIHTSTDNKGRLKLAAREPIDICSWNLVDLIVYLRDDHVRT